MIWQWDRVINGGDLVHLFVSGFPPSSSLSVLKLGKSQGNFYTMAHTLAEHGYSNYFVYGGEGHLDNMKGFFLSNGFDTAIDINDYDEFEFKGTWGVSDEDLFNRAHSIMLEEQSPFFTLIFSSSFHSPYEFPDGKIELVDEEKNTRHNGVKYAYMEGENVVIHQPDRAAEQYLYANKTLIPTTLQQDLARKALIWASLPGVLYREELYTPYSSAVQLP
ncbi:MAG: sulfatase-like hydrolase/transferase [bacterium]|nr:hypothetical protein [Gammaproteobacteria bacterium]HIL83873.1 hypothetical protein [Pseudomonadales bacterium]